MDAADIVHITATPAAVPDAIEAAVGGGRGVIVHDPTALLEGDVARQLAERAADAGVVVATPFAQRYYPMVRLARRRVRSGTPGPLHLLHGWTLRDGAGAWADLVEFVSGHRIIRVVVSAVAATQLDASDGSEAPGAAGLLFETDRGAVGTLAASHARAIDGGTLLFRLDGVEESIVFHEGRAEVLDVIGPRSTQRFQRGVGADVSRYSKQPAGHAQGYRDAWSALVSDAYAAVRGASPDGLPGLEDAARSAAVLDAIRDSDSDGSWARVVTDSDLLLSEGKTA
jgi:predicted dehydrogenase